MTAPKVLVFPTSEYRSLPIPGANDASKSRLGTCYVRVDDLPAGLEEWMGVNPRVPKLNKKQELSGPVARAMIRTLEEEPEKFALKNQGIYVLVQSMEFDREAGHVSITLGDKAGHGLVNGGHTYKAICQFRESRAGEPCSAFVRLHLMDGIPPDDIGELAEGLNRSMQVDDPSLENLSGTFDKIKAVLRGKSGETEIAYRQGDPGSVDIQQVLQMMSLFDLERFPDRKSHPNVLFGQPAKILTQFVEDQQEGEPVLDRVLPKLPEIMILGDVIQRELAPRVGKWKVSGAKKDNRAGSARHKNTVAHFAGGTIGARIPLGWIYPVLGALRGNVSRKAWKERREMQWLMDPTDLIKETIDECAKILYQEHIDNNLKPGEVGRKEAAYRGCYGVVTMALAEHGLLEYE